MAYKIKNSIYKAGSKDGKKIQNWGADSYRFGSG